MWPTSPPFVLKCNYRVAYSAISEMSSIMGGRRLCLPVYHKIDDIQVLICIK